MAVGKGKTNIIKTCASSYCQMWQVAWCQTCWRPGGHVSQQPVWSSAGRLARLVKARAPKHSFPECAPGNNGMWERCHILSLKGKSKFHPKGKETLKTQIVGGGKHICRNSPQAWTQESKNTEGSIWVETWFHWPNIIRSYSCTVHLFKSQWELVAASRNQCKEFPQVTPSLHGAVWGRF